MSKEYKNEELPRLADIIAALMVALENLDTSIKGVDDRGVLTFQQRQTLSRRAANTLEEQLSELDLLL